ncbi:hypothetical protein F3Y22_tig00111833pilonHSYRG00005 [Hibiscus syriacus]|uniref:Uncharacterized protein n=1 Tax=Hibiscus syriacus TaxID=106335 RepID=A0A6A2XCG6_HIBSY|nr:hypothetical protein F3Y22_tig00111833pilonHSYRG00005 [Hibiscus syriacus]
MLGKRCRDHKSSLKKKSSRMISALKRSCKLPTWNAQENTSDCEVGQIKLFDMIHTKKDGTPMTDEAAEIMEKSRDKRAEYEATTSSLGIVNADDIENQVINEVLGPERYGKMIVSFPVSSCFCFLKQPSDLLAALLGHPIPVSATRSFKSIEERKVSKLPNSSSNPKYVYLFQREYATVDPSLVPTRNTMFVALDVGFRNLYCY